MRRGEKTRSPDGSYTDSFDERRVGSPAPRTMSPLSCLSAVGLVVAGVGVKATPPQADCPRPADVEAALVRRLGQRAPAEGAAAEWSVAYVENASAQARSVEVALVDAQGKARLHRHVEVAPAECAAAADAIALIVERHFRDIGWTAGTPLPAPPPVEQPAVVVAPAPPGPQPPSSVRIHVGAGAGIESGSAAIELAFMAQRGWLTAGLDAFGTPAADRSSLPSGYTQRRSLGGRVAVSARAERGRWFGQIGPAVGLGVDFARSVDISFPAQNQRLWVAAGASAGAGVDLGRRTALSLQGSALRDLYAGSFRVADSVAGPLEVLERPAVSWSVALRLMRVFGD